MTEVVTKSDKANELVYTRDASYIDGCTLRYELFRRKNTDMNIEVAWLYDFSLTKLKGREVLDRAFISAVSSTYDAAVLMCETALRWGVSCISAYDFYEEFISR